MRRRRTQLVLLGAAVSMLGAAPLGAQTPAELIERGIRAYTELDFSASVGLLRRALGADSVEQLAVADRVSALSYLGAAELFRENGDSAMAVFRRAVAIDPRYQIDELVFPPEVTSLYALVKRDTKVVQVAAPDSARFRAGAGRFVAQLFASSYHEITATVSSGAGLPLRLLYDGLIGDSLEVVWDGLDSNGVAVPGGRHFLTVESRIASGTVVRVVRVPLDIESLGSDTLPHPDPLADSLLLPERARSGPGLQALIGGAIAGVGVALLPSSVAPGASLSAGRFVVAGAVTVAGVLGFVRQRPGRKIRANIAENEARRREWQARRDTVVRENELRRSRFELVIRVGRPTAVDLSGQ